MFLILRIDHVGISAEALIVGLLGRSLIAGGAESDPGEAASETVDDEADEDEHAQKRRNAIHEIENQVQDQKRQEIA